MLMAFNCNSAAVILKFSSAKTRYKNVFLKPIIKRNISFSENSRSVEVICNGLFKTFVGKMETPFAFNNATSAACYSSAFSLLRPNLKSIIDGSKEKSFTPFVSHLRLSEERYYSKQKEKTNPKEEIEEHWGGPEAFKLIIFLKDDFEIQLKKHESMLIFFSANWCHHCRQLRKPFGMAALMAKEANLPTVFATYDINHNPDFAQERGVVGIPLIKFYKNGKFVTNYKGKRTSDELFEFAKNPPTSVSTSTKIEF